MVKSVRVGNTNTHAYSRTSGGFLFVCVSLIFDASPFNLCAFVICVFDFTCIWPIDAATHITTI